MSDETTFNCPSCGALYEVVVSRRAAVESGRARCIGCRSVMMQWTTASPPTFRLIEN
jgi:transcription elongation factor Elf1